MCVFFAPDGQYASRYKMNFSYLVPAKNSSQMKQFLFSICILASTAALAQGGAYDKAPEFPGGNAALERYLSEKLVYPKKAEEKKIEGRVILGMIIDKKGRVTSINVIQHAHALLDSEAVRVVRAMPKWTPAQKGKSSIMAPVSLPITFKLAAVKKK